MLDISHVIGGICDYVTRYVQGVVVTLNITMTSTVSHYLCAPCMLCVMKMAVVSTIA